MPKHLLRLTGKLHRSLSVHHSMVRQWPFHYSYSYLQYCLWRSSLSSHGYFAACSNCLWLLLKQDVVEQDQCSCLPWWCLPAAFWVAAKELWLTWNINDCLGCLGLRDLSSGSLTLRRGRALSFQAHILGLSVTPQQKKPSGQLILIWELAEMGRVFLKHSRHFVSCLFLCAVFITVALICFPVKKQKLSK